MKFIIPAGVVLLIQTLQAQSLETVIQKGHELAVVAVAVSPDSNYVATVSKDKSAKLWEVNTGREVRSFLGHETTVTCVEFSSTGKYLLTGSHDKTVRLWDTGNGKELFSVTTPDFITDVAVAPNDRFFIHAGYNMTGYGDTAVVYDFNTRRVLAKMPVNPDKGLGRGIDIAISPDAKFVAFGEDNRSASLYETEQWKKIKTFDHGEGFCGGCLTKVLFSPDSKNLYMVSHHGKVKKYDLTTFELLRTYQDNVDDLTGFALTTDGRALAVATKKEIKLFDEAKGTLAGTLAAEKQGEFHQITFYTNNRLIVSSDDNTAFFWNFSNNKKELLLTGFLNQRDKGGLTYDPNFYWQSHIARYVRYKNALLISRDGKTLLKGTFGTKVKRWDIATGKSVMEYVGHKKAVLCYDLSKDGKRLLTGGGDGKIILWDVVSGDSLQAIKSYREPIFDIHFSEDETKVVSSSWDATMKIHDLQSGERLTYIEFENSAAYKVLNHPSDLYLFSARLDNSLQMWETDTRTVVRSFVGHTGVIPSLALSADRQTLLTASWDGSIRLWDIGTGLMIRKFKGHIAGVHAAIFSADEKSIFSAGADRTIRQWDIASSKVIRTFEGHKAEVTSLLLSPDNKLLITHSLDGVTKFWELTTGKEFFEHIHLGEKDWMVKTPEGYFNGTDDARKYVHFVSGKKTYAVDQFFNDFYRPDLLPKLFQSRGGNEEKRGIQGKLKTSPPPVIKIAVLPKPENKAEVYVRMTDMGSGVNNLRILHNGKSILLDPLTLTYPSGKDQQTTYRHEIDLVGGTNTFTAVASNKNNVESDPRHADIFSEHAAKVSTCYILAVGINEYKNGKLNLNYARPDAESFGKLMDENSVKLFKNIQLYSLYDREASKQKILSMLDELSHKVHQEDVFVFYYAGHGSMVDNKFYFIPFESLRLYDQSSLQKEAIEASVLQEKLKHIKALKQLIVMDACQSGGSVELLANRGASEEKAIAQLSRSTGIHVMASAGSEQFAAEFAELGHGLFTYVLIKGLQGEADGAPKDGKVTIYELKSYIDDQVPELTRKLKGKPQYPYTFSRGHDFPVVMLE